MQRMTIPVQQDASQRTNALQGGILKTKCSNGSFTSHT